MTTFEGGPKVEINSVEMENLLKQIDDSNIPFTHIMGISRGGLVPAVYISHFLHLPLAVAQVRTPSARDIAYGHHESYMNWIDDKHSSIDINSRVLIVDDISDTGSTLRAAVGHLTHQVESVYTAALHYRNGSSYEPDFYAVHLTKDDPWVVYPWEADHVQVEV